MRLEEAAAAIIATLDAAGVPFMVVGALSTNAYGIPRSTKDVDIVIQLDCAADLQGIVDRLPPGFHLDPQVTFETLTGNVRHVVRIQGTPFVIELFELRTDDEFQARRFGRRRPLFLPTLNLSAPIPTAEDVVVQKLRWGRPKDLDDARAILAVQGGALDSAHIEDWCRRLGLLARYETVRAGVHEG